MCGMRARCVARLCVLLIGVLFSKITLAQDTIEAQWALELNPVKIVVRADIDRSKLRSTKLNPKLLSIAVIAAPGSPESNNTLFIDDQVLVGFKTVPSTVEVERFSTEHHLELVHDASKGNGKVFIFRYRNFTETDNSLTIANELVQKERTLVAFAQPNRVNLFAPQSSNDTDIDL